MSPENPIKDMTLISDVSDVDESDASTEFTAVALDERSPTLYLSKNDTG